jgi:hypothetical protein
MRAYANGNVRHAGAPSTRSPFGKRDDPVMGPMKPPRLNFAGLCLRCDERDCTALECLAWHAESCWAICPDCDGLCWTEDIRPCGCIFGVVEIYPCPGDEARCRGLMPA